MVSLKPFTSNKVAKRDAQKAHSEIFTSSDSKKEKRQSRKCGWRYITLDTWFWEELAMIFSILCFIAITSVLFAYDNRASPSFPHGLTLNTIVSVLATASKSSLIFVVSASIAQLKWIWFRKGKRQLQHLQSFDDASRGPLGALVLVFQHKGQSLVSLGAIITVLALVFDPFMQQPLSYPVRDVSTVSSEATMKQSITFPSNTQIQYMNDAANAAVWSEDLSVTPTCPSGNCTWPSFRSTGWCSKCEDITSQAKLVGCTNITIDYEDYVKTARDIVCNVTLPYGNSSAVPVKISMIDAKTMTMEIPRDIIWGVSLGYMPFYPDANRTYMGVKEPTLVLAHAKLSMPGGDYRYYHPEQGLKIEKVTWCLLSICAQTYDVSVSNGVPTVNKSEPDYGEVFYHADGSSAAQGTYRCWQPGNGPEANVSVTSYDRWGNESAMAYCPVEGLSSGMAEPFAGNSAYFWSFTQWYSKWIYSQGDNDTSDNFRKIVNSSLPVVMKNAAASLTKFNLNLGNRTVSGNVVRSETYVSVNWTWLILPTGLLLTGVLFLVLTILVSRNQNLWKSSVLPMLYHGLDDNLLIDGNECVTVSAMEKLAQSVDAKLDYSDTKGRMILHNSI